MSKRWHAVEGQAVIGGEMHVGSTHKLYSRCIRTEEDKMVALKVGAGLGEEEESSFRYDPAAGQAQNALPHWPAGFSFHLLFGERISQNTHR